MKARTGHENGCSPEQRPALRQYALFVHKGIQEDARLDEKSLEELLDNLRYLCQILQPEAGWIGTAYVFVDPRWMQLFDGTGGFAGGVQYGARIAKLKQWIVERLPEARSCIRLVSSDDLGQLIAYAAEHHPPPTANLRRLLVGDSDRSLYDIPKLVKWLAQELNANGIPFYTFDLDVLFWRRPGDEEKCAAEFRQKLRWLCKRYAAEVDGNGFLFSGCYLELAKQSAFRGETNFDEFDEDEAVLAGLNGFAPRTLMLASIADTGKETVALDPQVAAAFMQSIKRIGTDAFDTSISGCGICLSDARFPMHSETGVNYVWTDDGLLYWFHRHLHRIDPSKDPVVYEACFTKPRVERQESGAVALPLKDVKWHLKNYLPGLVLGCVADAWVNRKDADGTVVGPGPYVKYVASALLDDDQQRQGLRRDLWNAARARLREVVDLWSGEAFKGTYLEVFVNGAGDPDRWNELGSASDFAPCGLERAVLNLSSKLPDDKPAASNDLSLRDSLLALIDGWILYLDFCKYWPQLVRAARACIEQPGSLGRDTWLLPTIEAAVPPRPIDLLLSGLQSDDKATFEDAAMDAAMNSWKELDLDHDEDRRRVIAELESLRDNPSLPEGKREVVLQTLDAIAAARAGGARRTKSRKKETSPKPRASGTGRKSAKRAKRAP